jgi:hypothetical protein
MEMGEDSGGTTENSESRGSHRDTTRPRPSRPPATTGGI